MAKKMDEFLIKELEFDLKSPDLGTRRHALISMSNMSRSEPIFEIFRRVMTDDKHPEIQYLARKFFNEWRPTFEQQPVEQPQVFTRSDVIDEGQVRQSFISKNRQIKLEVAKQIIERRDKRALPMVVDALQKEDDPFVISALVKAVGAVGDTAQITVLQTYLKHEDSRVRANTVEGLDMIGDDLVFPILVPMLQDPDNRVKGNTIKALLGYDEDAARELIVKLARSTKEGRRASACFCLQVAEMPWVEEILLGMIQREESVDLLKTQCELLAEVGSETSVGPLAVRLETAGRDKGRCYKFALDALCKRLEIDEAKVEDLKRQAREPATTDSGGGTSETSYELQKVQLPGGAGAGEAEKKVDFEQSRWDMDAIKDILPKTPKRSGARRLGAGGKARGGKDGAGKTAGDKGGAGEAKPGLLAFKLPEGASYLVPAGVGVILIFFAVMAWSFSGSGGGDAGPVRPTVQPGASVTLTCRVRFIDRKKSTMTLAHGHRYYLGRFPKEVDLSQVKVRDVVKVTGVQTTERHFDAVVLDCTTVEPATPGSGGGDEGGDDGGSG